MSRGTESLLEASIIIIIEQLSSPLDWKLHNGRNQPVHRASLECSRCSINICGLTNSPTSSLTFAIHFLQMFHAVYFSDDDEELDDDSGFKSYTQLFWSVWP